MVVASIAETVVAARVDAEEENEFIISACVNYEVNFVATFINEIIDTVAIK